MSAEALVPGRRLPGVIGLGLWLDGSRGNGHQSQPIVLPPRGRAGYSLEGTSINLQKETKPEANLEHLLERSKDSAYDHHQNEEAQAQAVQQEQGHLEEDVLVFGSPNLMLNRNLKRKITSYYFFYRSRRHNVRIITEGIACL